MHRGDYHVGPETTAIFSDPPAFIFYPALRFRDFQLARRLPGCDVLSQVERGEVLADNFALGVALEPLGTRVPCRHAAVGIETENGVVLDRFDHHAEAFLALAKRGAHP